MVARAKLQADFKAGALADNNIRAAYLHVLADAITSVAAILGLVTAMIWGLPYVDALAALISSAVIIRWSLGLLRDSGRELIA